MKNDLIQDKNFPRTSTRSLLRRRKSVMEITAACQQWTAGTAARLAALLAPELTDEEAMPDLALLQELLRRSLERRWRRASEMDEAYLKVRLCYRELVAERGQAVRVLYRALGDLRAILRGLHGAKEAARLIGFGGDTSRDPLVLMRQADRALEWLRQRPEPLVVGAVAAVAAAVERLRDVAGRTSATACKFDGAIHDRQRSLAALNEAFVEVAGWFEATYRLSGCDYQAEAVRPSRQRPGLLHQVQRQREAVLAGRAAAAAAAAPAADAKPDVGVPDEAPPADAVAAVVEAAAPPSPAPAPESPPRQGGTTWLAALLGPKGRLLAFPRFGVGKGARATPQEVDGAPGQAAESRLFSGRSRAS